MIMSMPETLFIVLIIMFIIVLGAIGLSDEFRNFISGKFDDWSYKKRQRRRLFRDNSTHIRKYDCLKFYSSIIGIFLAVIVVSGMLSHFGAIGKVKKVCYARLEDKNCNTINEHKYFIPGNRANIFDFPYKLGVIYTCGCSIQEKTIMMNMAKKNKPEVEKESPLDNFIRWLTEPTNNNT